MPPIGTPPPIEATIQLRDGRRLALFEVGPRDGSPLIQCHGNPSSRLEAALLAEQAISHGVRPSRWRAPSRPLSD
jgi:hypothetical protein